MLEKIYYSNNLNKYSDAWDDNTFYLYVLTFIVVLIGGFFVQSVYRQREMRINLYIYVLLFSFLYVFYAFRDVSVGRDTEMYTKLFLDSHKLSNIKIWGIEPGFFCLNSFFGLFFQQEKWGVIIFSSITLLCVFSAIYLNRKVIDVAMALFLFVGIGFYLQSFNLLRISLATSIELLFFNLVIERKYLKYLVVLLVCFTIHYTTLLMFIPLLSLLIYRVNKSFFFCFMLGVLIVSLYAISHMDSFIFFARYEHYSVGDLKKVGIGMVQFFYNLPILLLLFYVKKRRYCSRYVFKTMLVYTLFCFLYGVIGYYIPVGRSVIHFLMIFVIFIPYSIGLLQKHHDENYLLIKFLFLFYGVIRFHLYLKDYLYSDGIMPYKFIAF